MNDYMLRVLNDARAQKDWPQEKHLEFVRKCEAYIEEMRRRGQLLAAQPLARQGVLVSRAGAAWNEEPLQASGEMQVGYYIIRAKDISQAVEMAKGNPEFQYGTSARVEVRPLNGAEDISGYKYPTLAPNR